MTPTSISDNNRIVRGRKTITEALKQSVRQSGESLYAISKATGLNHDSLSRFMRGRQSLRLDLADRLAEYLGIQCRREKGKAK